MRKEKKQKTEAGEKLLALRIIGFVLAFLAAVSAFSFGVTRIGYKEEGMYELTAAADQELPLYQSGVHAKFRFQGSSSQIKLAIGNADKIYTEALKRYRKLLDAEREYDGVQNLATLNARPNEEVAVGPELFAVLTDAYAKTLERQGYSLFAGPVYAEWASILNLTEPEDFDPLRNAEEAARLEQLRQRTGELDRLRLTVVDEEKGLLRLEVPEDYVSFLEDMELEPVFLDLNLLQEAYLLELTAAALEEQGLCEGYLSTDSGLILSLSGQDRGEYTLYGAGKGEPVLTATAKAEPGSAYSLFTAFPLVSGVETPFYAIEEGRIHLRNPWLPADGRDAELLLSSCVIRTDGMLTEACYENIRLRTAQSPGELETLAAGSDAAVAWMLQGDSSETVFRNAQAEGLFTLSDG